MSKLVGDWMYIQNVIKSMIRRLPQTRDEILQELGIIAHNEVKSIIELQFMQGPDIAKKTRERKRKLGRDLRRLIETGKYKDSFSVKKLGNSIYVAPKSTEMVKRAGWLEFGTDRIPARPHIRIALNRTMKRRRVKKILDKHGLTITSVKKHKDTK